MRNLIKSKKGHLIKLTKHQKDYVEELEAEHSAIKEQLLAKESQMKTYLKAILDDKGVDGADYEFHIDKGFIVNKKWDGYKKIIQPKEELRAVTK